MAKAPKICLRQGCVTKKHSDKAVLPLGTVLIGMEVGNHRAKVLVDPILKRHQLLPSDNLDDRASTDRPVVILVGTFQDHITTCASPSEELESSPHVSWEDEAILNPSLMGDMEAMMRDFTTPVKVQAHIKEEQELLTMEGVEQTRLFEADEAGGAGPLPGIAAGLDDGPQKDLLLAPSECLVEQSGEIAGLHKCLINSRDQVQENPHKIGQVSTAAQQALLKVGECPSGQTFSGSFCLEIVSPTGRPGEGS